MPGEYDYYCTDDSCDFTAPEGWGYYMYAVTDDGERVTCPHPGEREAAREVIGSDATEAELDDRTGFNYYCVCLNCVAQFDLDPERDEMVCPDCGGEAVERIVDLVDEPCPACESGTFVAEDTGNVA